LDRVKVTNADRVMFPEVGLTKGDLVDFYERVAGPMFPYVRDRPLTLERYPQGLAGEGFMQKNAAAHFPDTIGRYEVDKAEGGTTNYPVITVEENIPYLANQGTVTFHVWTGRLPFPHLADCLVIDLDPEPGDVDSARIVTARAGSLVQEFGLESLLVATGSKGYHVWVPLVPTPWEQVALASRALAGIIAARDPAHATIEFLKKNRKGRVFVDWLRNNSGATVVSPLSVRARPRASITMPLDWSELSTTDPDQWTVADLNSGRGHRLDRLPGLPEPGELPLAEIVTAAEAEGVDLETSFDRFGRER
jgi:bifunctional non-homologous end joining protein LigD